MLTVKNIRFLDNLRSDPQYDQGNAYMKAYPATKKRSTAMVCAHKIMAKPEAVTYLLKKAAKANATVDNKEEDILNDLMEVRDKCMGRDEVNIVKITKDGDIVEGTVKEFNAGGATKALELLGRNKKMFTDKVDLTGSVQNVEYNFNLSGADNDSKQ